MSKKVAIFAFQGDFMCFVHVLMNAIDMKEKGFDVKIIIEGSATKVVPEMASDDSPLHKQYVKAKEMGIIEGACRACSAKMGVVDAVKHEGIALLGDMHGHPGMAAYIDGGCEILTFG